MDLITICLIVNEILPLSIVLNEHGLKSLNLAVLTRCATNADFRLVLRLAKLALRVDCLS